MNRILFVDDEPNVLAGLKRLLHGEEPEFECVGVTSATTALEHTAGGDIDVVVSDIRMPGMDGIDFLTRLKGDTATQNIPVIMLTGHADADARRLALQLGAYDFLNKPADPHELVARLRNALRLKSYEDQLKSQHDALVQQVLQLQKLEVIGILASGVAHDLNNVLGSISGHTELAALGLEDSTPASAHLKLVLDSVDHATKLVQQILSLGRSPDAARQECDLKAVAGECVRLLDVTIAGGIEVTRQFPEKECQLLADPTQLRQVVMNLCINAIQAMNGNGTLGLTLTTVELDAKEAAELGGLTAGPHFKFGVSDTGAGMDAATQARIFEPFYTTKEPGRGTGLGLPVADRIIRNHGGAMRVESTPGVGTTFSLFFPRPASIGGHNADREAGTGHAREAAHSLRG